MSVETPQIKIDPYKSEVPMAPVVTPTQIPVQDSAPANKIYSRAGGIAEVADMGLKGYLKGLQVKEERKLKEAKATMATQDTAVADAKKRYSDSLVMYGKDDDRTKAAWTEYGGTVNKAADIYQKFAIQETGTKTPKGQKKSKTAPDGAPAAGGFVGALKQFATRNPHLVPELAIMGMRSQVAPGLYGQMAPEDTQRKQQYDAAQRDELKQQARSAEEATVRQYAGKSRAELQAAPASLGGQRAGFKNALEEYNNALIALNPPKPIPAAKPGTPEFYYDKKAQELGKDVQDLTSEELQDAKAEWAEAGRAESQANLYYDAAAREWGTTRDKLTTAQLEYVDANRARSQAQAKGQTTYSYRTTDANGNSSTVTRKVSEPISTPQGVKALPEKVFSDSQEDSQKGGDKNQSPTPGTGKSGSPLNPYPNPEDQPRDVSLKFNAPWTAPDWQSKVTKLSPADEAEFQKWAAANPKAVEGELDPATADYDVRGHWLAAKKGEPEAVLVPNKWDGKLHGNDKFKLPSNGTFSNESMYATPDAPRWQGNKLVTKDGKIVTDETPKKTGKITKPPAAPGAGRGNLAAGFPTQGGGVTPMRTKSDLALEKAVSDEYGKADTHFNEELDKIDQAAHQANNPLSPAEVKTRTDRVTQAYNDEKARITRARVSQIEAAGGDPWKRRAKDDKGNEIGTMDDVSWKNTRTGYDVPAPSGGPQAAPTATQGAAAGQKKEPNPAKKTEAGSEIKSYGDPGPGKKAYIIRCVDGSEAKLYLDDRGLAIIKSHPTTAGVVEDN